MKKQENTISFTLTRVPETDWVLFRNKLATENIGKSKEDKKKINDKLIELIRYYNEGKIK